MTINVVDVSRTQTGNGLTTVFNGPVAIRSADVSVSFFDGENFVPLVEDTDYTVSGVGSGTSTTITIVNTDYIPNYDVDGTYLSLLSDADPTQETVIPPNKLTATSSIEFSLDLLTILVQQLEENISDSIRLDPRDFNSNLILPLRSQRLNKVLSFDENGNIATTIDTVAGDGGSASTAGSAAEWGSDYGLLWDGTDQTDALNSVLASNSYVRLRKPSTATFPHLYIAGTVTVPSNTTLDLSQTPIDFGKYGNIAIEGSLEESPSSDLIRLASDAAAGASTIYLNSVNASNATLLGANGTVSYVIIRGKSDASAKAIQRHEGLLTIVDNADTSNIECTIDPPLPDDEGTWEVDYAAGDYEAATGLVDRTLISVVTSAVLASNVAENDQVITLSDATDFQPGTLAVLYDDRLASSVDGISTNSIRTEIIKVRRQPAANELVYPEVPITKDFLTANNARLLKITPVENAHIVGLRCEGIVEEPDDPGPRIHYAKGSYCIGCTIRDVQIDESTSTYEHRGQAARFERAYDCHIIGGYRKFSPTQESGSGDDYAAALYYCNQSTIVGFESWFARHGTLAQGSVNGAFIDCRAISPQINGWDLHGLDERNWVVLNCVSEGPEWGAGGASQRSGGTIGSSFHAVGPKGVTVSGGSIRGFQAGDNSSGIGVLIRSNVTKVQILDSVRITDCDRGVQFNADSEFPSLKTGDIDIRANMDRCYVGVGVNGAIQAWDASTTYTGTATRPEHVESDDKIYSTSTTTVGGSAPTHSSGTVGDWTYVKEAERLAYDVRVSGIIRNATRPIVPTGVDDLNVTEVDIQAAQQIELTDCPNVLFRDITGAFTGGVWLETLAGNTNVYLDGIYVGGAALTNTDSATIVDRRLVGLSNIDLVSGTPDGTKVLGENGSKFQWVDQAGGVSATNFEALVVGNGAVITAAAHAALSKSGTAIKERMVVLREATVSNAIGVTIEENLAKPVLIMQAPAQTGICTITRSGTNTINGATSIVLSGPRASVWISPTDTVGVLNAEGETTEEVTLVGGVSSPITSVSGALTKAVHSGRVFKMSGDCTVTAEDGLNLLLIASGASRNINAGGANTAVADGDAVNVFSDGTTVWITPAVTLDTLPTS